MGVIYAMEEGTLSPLLHAKPFSPLLHAKFHPIGATCHPCGAKNLKIGLE